MTLGRGPALVLLAVVLAAGLAVDHSVGRHAVPVAGAPALPALPAQAPAGSLSSTWFCPAGTAADNGLADVRVVVTDPGDADVTGTITVIPSQGPSQQVPLRVGPRRRAAVRLGDSVQAPYAAALVQLDGSAGAVEEQIRGALGESTTPCATQASDRWYFGWGTTRPGAQLLVSLFNPFPGDAIVDLDFATETGRTTPADLQGIIVPGRGVTVVDIGAHVRRRQSVSTTVSARTGRIVAERIQLQGTDGSHPAGAVVSLGSPAPGPIWYFPDGVIDHGVNETFEIFNPTDNEADVQIALSLDRGGAEPFSTTIAPHDRYTLVVNGETRIPPGDPHATTITSTNGVPVVAERVITAGPPSSRLGVAALVGAPRSANRWLFGVGAANSDQDEWLVVFNPGSGSARFSVTALLGGRAVGVEGLQGVTVQPGERLAMRLGDHLDRGDLVAELDSDAPVVVERDLYRVGGLGMSAALGIPLDPAGG